MLRQCDAATVLRCSDTATVRRCLIKELIRFCTKQIEQNTVLKAQPQGGEKIERDFPTGGEVRREGWPAIRLRRGPGRNPAATTAAAAARLPPACVVVPSRRCDHLSGRTREGERATQRHRASPLRIQPIHWITTSASFLVGLGMQYHHAATVRRCLIKELICRIQYSKHRHRGVRR